MQLDVNKINSVVLIGKSQHYRKDRDSLSQQDCHSSIFLISGIPAVQMSFIFLTTFDCNKNKKKSLPLSFNSTLHCCFQVLRSFENWTEIIVPDKTVDLDRHHCLDLKSKQLVRVCLFMCISGVPTCLATELSTCAQLSG